MAFVHFSSVKEGQGDLRIRQRTTSGFERSTTVTEAQSAVRASWTMTRNPSRAAITLSVMSRVRNCSCWFD